MSETSRRVTSCFHKMFSCILMFWIWKLNEFLHEKSLEENPGSAAESQVRPPNMHAFWRHVRPPKAWVREVQVRPPNMACMRRHIRPPNVAWPATIKGSLSRKRASFFPIFGQGEFSAAPPRSWVFSFRSFKIFTSFCFVLKIFEFKVSFGVLRFKNSKISHLRV